MRGTGWAASGHLLWSLEGAEPRRAGLAGSQCRSAEGCLCHHQRVSPTPFCHQESSKSQCSGSLHFPNKTLHKLLNEASCPVEFNPSPISVYPFPQNVISPPHYWIPSEPCHWWIEATRREEVWDIRVQVIQKSQHTAFRRHCLKRPQNMWISCCKGTSENT